MLQMKEKYDVRSRWINTTDIEVMYVSILLSETDQYCQSNVLKNVEKGEE